MFAANLGPYSDCTLMDSHLSDFKFHKNVAKHLNLLRHAAHFGNMLLDSTCEVLFTPGHLSYLSNSKMEFLKSEMNDDLVLLSFF